MQLDQVAHNGEPQPQAAVGSRGRAIGLPKPVKHSWQEIGTDSLSVVADGDARVRVIPLEEHIHTTAFRGKLHGVRDQVPTYLLQPGRVAGNWTNARTVRVSKQNRFRIGSRPHHTDGRLDGR